MAERLGKTVQELLTGKAGPLSNQEYVQWIAYTAVHNDKQKQAQRKSQAKAGRRR